MISQHQPLIKLVGIACLTTLLYGCSASTPVVQQEEAPTQVATVSNSTPETQQRIDNNAPLSSEIEEQFNHGVRAIYDQNFDKAEEIFLKMTQSYPTLSGPFANLGSVLTTKKEYASAELAFLRALELNKQNPEIYNQLGLMYRQSGQFNKALEIYKQGLETAPENPNLLRNIGILLELYLGTPEAALEYYQRYLETKPNDKQVQIWIADLSQRIGQ